MESQKQQQQQQQQAPAVLGGALSSFAQDAGRLSTQMRVAAAILGVETTELMGEVSFVFFFC